MRTHILLLLAIMSEAIATFAKAENEPVYTFASVFALVFILFAAADIFDEYNRKR